MFIAAAHAAQDPRLWLDVGVEGTVGAGRAFGGGGGTHAGIGVAFAPEPARALGLVAHAREEVVSNATPAGSKMGHVGGISIDLRWPCGTGPYVLGGFAHHHETAFADYVARPVPVTLAIDPAITHRTGLEAGAGWDFAPTVRDAPFWSRLRARVDATVTWLPGTGDPPVYLLVEAGVRFGLDRNKG